MEVAVASLYCSSSGGGGGDSSGTGGISVADPSSRRVFLPLCCC